MKDSFHHHLKEFVDSGSQAAFARVVDDYCGLVFGTALRQVGNRHLAEEVAQDVFTKLATKAASIRQPERIGAWLHRTTLLTAANAIRKDSRRRNAMHQFSEIESGKEQDEVAVWQDAAPHLDEAMNRLSQAEREAVVLRFYEGHTYRKIGELLGKSEDGTRKQISRAMEKMSLFLTRRGVALPAGAIGAGLSHALTEISLGEVARNVAAGVTIPATASSSGGAGAAAWLSALLVFPPAVVGVAALALLCAVAIAGYYSTPGQLGQERSPETVRASSPATEKKFPTALTNRETKVSKLTAQSLEAILQQAEVELDLATIEANAGYRAELYLRAIPESQLPAALDLIRRRDGGHLAHFDLSQMLIAQWASFDGDAAITYALENLEGSWFVAAGGQAIPRWVENQPLAAWQWMEAQRENHVTLIGGLSILTFDSWAKNNLPEATQHALEIEDENIRRLAVKGILESGRAHTALNQVDRLIASLTDTTEQSGRVSGFVWIWAMEDPPAAADWLLNESPRGIDRGRAELAVAQRWLAIDAPAAADWMLAEDAHVSRWSLLDVVQNWQKQDAYGLGEWLADQPLDAGADNAVASFANYITGADPEAGVSWARSIRSEPKRLKSLRAVFKKWRQTAPDAASEYIASKQWSVRELEAISAGTER